MASLMDPTGPVNAAWMTRGKWHLPGINPVVFPGKIWRQAMTKFQISVAAVMGN